MAIYSKEATNAEYRPMLTLSYYVDTIAPTIVSFNPNPGYTGMELDADMLISFSETVSAVTGKNIILKKLSDNDIVETIDAADTGKVTIISNNIVRINPTNDLLNDTGYYIEIEE